MARQDETAEPEQLRMLFLVFEIYQSANSHNCNCYHYHKKSVHGQSSFAGVMTIAAAKITIAMKKDVNKTLKRCCSFVKSIIAPIVVSKYFTKSKRRSATFSLFK